MKKMLALVVVSLSVGLPLAINQPTTARAAKWHQGTPKVLRGKWEHKITVGKGQNAFRAPEGVKITKKGFSAYSFADPFVMGKVKYQKTSKHYYTFKGIETMYSNKTYKVRIHQVGKRLQFVTYYPNGGGHYTKMGKMTAWIPKK
ncbi:hypothetical protein [Levilactobacillus yonginensis]|uniref:hypothetical protein n=1 Tax=Levilactobacillus yonginensis TaxID=1054041 RepID=UPI00345DC75C